MIVPGSDPATPPCGYVATGRLRPLLRPDDLQVLALAVEPTAPLPALVPALLRALAAPSPGRAGDGGVPPPARLVFALGRNHPLYAYLGPRLAPALRRRYAWFVRVPHPAALVQHVAPALERRLAASPAAGHNGELHLDFYRGGLRLVLARGRVVAVEPWQLPPWEEAEAGMPASAFAQLLFGYRDLAALYEVYPDVWTADDTTHAVLHALFPARPSWVPYLD